MNPNMSTEYRIRIDRSACDGIFACLLRDDRFIEADDGLATIEGAEPHGDDDGDEKAGETTAQFLDGRITDARLAARACPVDAIDVTVIDDA